MKLLHLSAAGTLLLRQVQPFVHRVQDRLLAPLAEADRATLLRLLGKLAGQHNKVTPAPLRVGGRPPG